MSKFIICPFYFCAHMIINEEIYHCLVHGYWGECATVFLIHLFFSIWMYTDIYMFRKGEKSGDNTNTVHKNPFELMKNI